ncbi:MAG: EAL domain-containing protein [Holophagaceae bacterium]|nr:EAL domain-containing protein [Holophagaceae bacterium]
MPIANSAEKLDSVLPVLYDLAQTIGSELSVKTLLPRSLQRLLYHTSFPAGFMCLAPGIDNSSGESIGVTITAAIGDLRLIKIIDTVQLVSADLFAGAEIQEGAVNVLDSVPGKKGHYTCFLRLKVDGYGFIFLLGPKLPDTNLPLSHMFEPVLAHLGRAILLCSANDAQKDSLIVERDELADKQRLSAKMLDSINSGIFVTNERKKIISVNEAFIKLTNLEPSFIVGKYPNHFFSKKNNPVALRQFLKKLEENDNWIGEVNIRRTDYLSFPSWMMFSAIRDDIGSITNYMGIFTDLSEKKEKEELIDHLFFHDALTSLPNIVSFKDKFAKSVSLAESKSSELFLLSINIDNFNTVNNSLGYTIGDKLLVKLADRLVECVGELGIVSRSSADNFLVLLTEVCDRDDVDLVAKKILDALSKPSSVENVSISITSTIGISIFPDNGRDFDTLFRHADTALKYAKASDRSYYKFFTDSMDKIMIERFSIESHLRTALEHNELTLYYQPFVKFETGKVCGVEALLRWDNPTLGRVSPASFIPVAEQTGMILSIGEWVLNEACRQLSEWQKDGVPIDIIAVNLSAIQFRKADVGDMVKKYLKQYQINPKNLELELTESIMMHNTEQSLKTVADLKEIGIDLSLDDFGTGYSSFSYLSRFPIDKLKIDQSFVRDIAINPGAAKIVKAIIDLSNSLELVTIAEGIEQIEQFDVLKKFGCTIAQGYLFSKPLPAPELAKNLSSDGYLTNAKSILNLS